MVALDVEVMENLGVHEKVGEPESLENTENSGVGVKQEEDRKPQPGAISGGNFYGNSNGNGAHVKQESTSRSLPPKSAAGGGGTSAHGNIYPIESLSPYAHKWTIKARCTVKSDIKTWHKQTGEGKLFSVTFMDETGEIRATGFNEQVDQLYEVFQPGSVYYISSPCRVQIAKKQFSNVNNDYELTFERDTAVEKAEEDNSVPSIRYNFTNIQDLQKVEANSTVDLVGVIKDVGEVSQITSKSTGKPYDKREISLVDNSGFSVRMTLWGNTAQSFEGDPDQVVAFKGVKVSDFGGRSCSLLSSGTMAINPDIDEAHRLKGWYDAQGNTADFTTHSSTMGTTNAGGRKDVYKTTKQVQDENLGMSEQADYFTLKATVVYIKSDNIAYPACQSEGCNKKIVEINPGEWRCERCDKSFEKPQYRYIISANVSDHTGQIWLSCFDEVGRMMLGMDGNDLMDMKENDERAFGEKVANANCQTWIFRCRAKMDTFQDQTRYVANLGVQRVKSVLTSHAVCATRSRMPTPSITLRRPSAWPS